MKNVRSNLTRPKVGWGNAGRREGLSARLLTDEEREDRNARHRWSGDIAGERKWTVEYSKGYRGTTRVFMHMVTIGGATFLSTLDFIHQYLATDAEGIQQMLQEAPFHADTLLQMSEIYFHREGTSEPRLDGFRLTDTQSTVSPQISLTVHYSLTSARSLALSILLQETTALISIASRIGPSF